MVLLFDAPQSAAPQPVGVEAAAQASVQAAAHEQDAASRLKAATNTRSSKAWWAAKQSLWDARRARIAADALLEAEQKKDVAAVAVQAAARGKLARDRGQASRSRAC